MHIRAIEWPHTQLVNKVSCLQVTRSGYQVKKGILLKLHVQGKLLVIGIIGIKQISIILSLGFILDVKDIPRKLWDAVFVLPLTAGALINRVDKSHDGTIAGPVLFTSLLAIVCQIFRIGASSNDEHEALGLLSTLLTIMVFIVVACLIAISIYVQVRPETRRGTHCWNTRIALEIRFYWLFSLACMTYNVIKLCNHIEWYKKTHRQFFVPEAIAYDIVFFFFYLVQTEFFTQYLHYKFIHNKRIYYALLTI